MNLRRRLVRPPGDDLERHLMRARRREEPVELLVARLRGVDRGTPARLLAGFRLTDSVAIRRVGGDLELTGLFDAADLKREGVERRLRAIAGGDVELRWARFPDDGLTLPALLDPVDEVERCA